MKLVPHALFLVATLSLSACGGSSGEGEGQSQTAPSTQTASSEANVDPCSFITAEEVAAITGDKVIRTSASKNGCKYHSEPEDGADTEISLTDGANKMEVARKTVSLLGGMGKKVSEESGSGAAADTGALLTASKADVPPVGDEALWGINAMLYARKGDIYVEVTPPLMHDPATTPGIPLIPAAERREIAVKIATKMLERAAAR